MPERAYTVSEIDALRRAVDNRYLWGTTCIAALVARGGGWGRSHKEAEKAISVEQTVRTYMLAGILAEDIIAEDEARYQAAIADQSPKGRDGEAGSMRSTRAAVAEPIANTSLSPNPEKQHGH